MSEDFRLVPGTTPLLLSMPHVGTAIPDDIAGTMTDAGRAVADTDWHVDRLYDFAGELGAGVLTATWSRHVVDLNRDPTGKPLYADADNTEICPLRAFDRSDLYQRGQAPDADAVIGRVERYWRPYHAALAKELAAVKARHGHVVLFDCHSIRSRVPRLFEGRLPDLNLGTAHQRSCNGRLAAAVQAVLEDGPGYSFSRDGRFTGGYITRTYGRPNDGQHALQLELTQASYMQESPPWRYRPDLARNLRPILRRAVEAMLAWSERQPKP